MNIRKGDRFQVRKGSVYEVLVVGARAVFNTDGDRIVRMRNITDGRRMNRYKYRVERQVEDRRWKMLDRFPAILRLPVGV